jgi:phage-related protein
MTEDVSAGRLVADVVSDTTGFAQDVRRKINAEVKGIRARIKVEIDQRGLVGQARAAAKVASQSAVVKFRAEVDTRGLVGQARAAAQVASEAATVRLRAELDTRQVAAQARVAAAAASRQGAQVQVGADTSKADQDVENFRRRTRSKSTDIGLNTAGLGQASVALMQLSKAPAIAGGVFLLGTAVVQVGAGLVAMTSAATQAVGVVGMLPNLVGILGQSLATVLIGSSGIGEALKAMAAAEEASTTATAEGGAVARATARAVESASRARERAARSVGDAQRALQDAQKAADDTAEQGARAVADARRALADARAAAAERERAAIERVSDAEWSLARAQEAAQDAQANLTAARERARERVEDLNMALRHSALDEEAAVLAVEQAAARLADVNFDPRSSDLEKRSADLAHRQAVARLEEVRERNGDLQQETAKANDAGVEGAEEVEQARDQVRDTIHAEQEATENLIEAQRSAAKEQRDSARAISDAQRHLADTIEANADAGEAAARRIADAQRGIADAQQNLADAERNLADAQATAAEGGTQAATAAAKAQAALDKLSPAQQRFAKFLFGLKPRWIDLRNTVAEALLPPVQRGITAALPLLGVLETGLAGTAVVIGGLVEDLGELLGSPAFGRDVATIMASNNRALRDFGQAGLYVVQILRDLGVAAGPLVERFARWTRALTAGWAETIKTKRATGELTDFFDRSGDVAAQLGRILSNVGSALFNIGKSAVPSGQELLDMLERVTQKWDEWTGSEEGQQRMREFFEAVQPVTEELGRLVANVIEFITKISEDGGGPMTAFLQTLNAVFEGLNRLMEIPGAGPALATLLTLAGVGGALGLVAAVILRMGKNIGKLAKFTGLSKLVSGLRDSTAAIKEELPQDEKKKKALGDLDKSAKKSGTSLKDKFAKGVRAATSAVKSGVTALAGWIAAQGRAAKAAAATTLAVGRQRAAAMAQAVAANVSRIATAAWAVVQGVLNKVMNMNPLARIVLLIGLVVGALLVAYREHEGFRKVVQAVWAAIQAAAKWAWEKVLRPTLTGLWQAVRTVGGWMKWLWQKVMSPVWSAIAKGVQLYWTYYLKPILTALWTALKTVGGWMKWLWEKAIQPALKAIRDYFYRSWHETIKPAWNAFTGAIKSGWENVIKPAFDAIKNGIAALPGAFTSAKDAVKRAWDLLKGVVKAPIKGVLELINAWVIDKFNWVSGKLGGPKIDRIDLAGFRDGGTIPGKRRGARADNVVIRATPDEFMVRRWAADRLRRMAPGALEYINRFGQLPGYAVGGLIKRARAAMPGYAEGGFVRPVNAPYSGVWGKYRSGGNHPALDFPVPVGTPVVAVMDGVVNAVKSLAGSYGKHIRITHANGMESIYAHLSDMLVNVGQQISAGQFIGRSGNTGNSTGPHLHLELRRNGSAFNFTDMLNSGRAPTTGGKSALERLLGGLTDQIKGVVGEPLEWFRKQIDKPAQAFRSKFGNTQMAQMLSRMPFNLAAAAADRVKRLLRLQEEKAIVENPSLGLGLVRNIANQNIVRAQAATRGWTGKQWLALDWLVRKESGYNHLAQNPTSTAYGLGQFLDSTWATVGGHKTSDPVLQTKYMLEYIAKRYGNPMNARAFHLSHNWYDRGGWLYDDTVPHNATGKPEAVLTNPQWNTVDDILSILARATTAVRPADDSPAAGAAPLVGSLALTVGERRDLPDALDELEFRLRRLRQGGVHASRTAGSPA